MGHKIIAVLMGPTGAGKSALALEIAARRPAVIINADAMQMVSALRVMTARPTQEEEAMAQHALYGVLMPHEPTSVAVWLKLVAPVIRTAWAQGNLPLLVGGTGMYIKALMEGLAVIPPVPHEVRRRVRDMVPRKPGEGWSLHDLLLQCDPVMAAHLKPQDTQRILRALEVMVTTGISLATWRQRGAAAMFPEAEYKVFAAIYPREEIYRRIDARFRIMMKNGALDEVQSLLALGLDSELPILRAHGVPELAAHLRGEITLATAVARGQQNTRNYAKRQITWLRNQLPQALEVTGAGTVLAALEDTTSCFGFKSAGALDSSGR